MIAIIRLLLPMVFAQFGGGGVLAQIVYIAFALISCLLGGGLMLPRH